MIIKSYGGDRRCAVAEGILRHKLEDRAGRLHLFAVPTKSEAKAVEARRGDFAVGYAFPSSLAHDLAERGVTVADAEKDERFLSANAYLTALATAGYLLQTQTRAPGELKIGIIGYGRIGRELLRLLLFLGADCRVYTASEEKRRELGECGIESALSSENREKAGGVRRFSGLDLLINTAPARLIREEEAEELSGVRVIELASGDNIPADIPYERLASLPAKTYPESAGRLYADFALRALGEEAEG